MATVSSAPRTTTFTVGLASVGPFLVGFRLFDTDGLDIYVDGVKTTSFTIQASFVSGFDDSATVTFNTALETGVVVVIDGALTPARAQDYLAGDAGLTEKMNIELARIWSAVSEVKRDTERAIRGFTAIDPSAAVNESTVVDGSVYASASAASAAESAASAALADADRIAAALSASEAQASEALLGLWRDVWLTATVYALGDRVSQSGNSYYAKVAHTSGVFATDLAALKWGIVAEKGASGGGTGDLLASQNLNDLANKPIARGNLGLGSLATQASNSVSITGGNITGITDIAIADGGTGASDAPTALVNFGLTATAGELNILDGVTATAAEINRAADSWVISQGSLTGASIVIGIPSFYQGITISYWDYSPSTTNTALKLRFGTGLPWLPVWSTTHAQHSIGTIGSVVSSSVTASLGYVFISTNQSNTAVNFAAGNYTINGFNGSSGITGTGIRHGIDTTPSRRVTMDGIASEAADAYTLIDIHVSTGTMSTGTYRVIGHLAP
jgi:hypothetical protein